MRERERKREWGDKRKRKRKRVRENERERMRGREIDREKMKKRWKSNCEDKNHQKRDACVTFIPHCVGFMCMCHITVAIFECESNFNTLKHTIIIIRCIYCESFASHELDTGS